MTDESCCNIFAEKNGYTIHFKLVAKDMPHAEGQSDLAALMAGTETMLDWMSKHGYARDTSRDRARGGGKKPADPIPADLADKVPMHCGVPMEYKAAWTNNSTGKQVGAKFQCAKGEACEQHRVYQGKKYPHDIFEDAYRKQLAGAA